MKHGLMATQTCRDFLCVREKAMASSPCDCWPHLSPPPSSSIEHVWNDITLASLSNSPVDLDFNNNHSVSDSSFLKLTSTSSSVFHKPDHSLLSVSNTSFEASLTKKTTLQDQRHKRIIKNRESAVRSRARKQAYRKGLEVEIARLTQENSRLKIQLKELQCCLSPSGNPPTPRMAALCRTSSSPF